MPDRYMTTPIQNRAAHEQRSAHHRYNEGDLVLIEAKGTAWNGHRATIRCVATYAPTEYWVQIEGRYLTARFKERELHPYGAIDRLAEIHESR